MLLCAYNVPLKVLICKENMIQHLATV